jgi:glycosyltransferase involved in cell wall biosynthesis
LYVLMMTATRCGGVSGIPSSVCVPGANPGHPACQCGHCQHVAQSRYAPHERAARDARSHVAGDRSAAMRRSRATIDRGPRLAIHVGSREWGGAEQELARLAPALAGRGCEVRVYCNQPGHVERFASTGVRAERVPLRGDVSLPDALRFGLVLRRFAPDVLLVGIFKKMWLAGLAARSAGVSRVLVRVLLQTDVPRNAKYHFALRHLVEGVVLNAREQAPPFLALPGWDERRVHTIYNYYRAAPAATGNVRASLGIPADATVTGAVARLATQKRLERLVEAVAPVDALHCIIAGDGPERARLEALAHERGAARRVHFLGQRDDVPAVLAALDVFVICSDREGMSNAMLEALAAGVPVVSTPVSGAREALEPLADGTEPGLITAPDPEVLRAAILQVATDRTRRNAMSVAARRRMAERFDPELIVEQWLQLLGAPR